MGGFVAIALKALQAIGPITAALPEFKALWDQISGLVDNKDDQATLKRAYEELMAENSGGHARLQEMLRQAQAVDLQGKPVAGLKEE